MLHDSQACTYVSHLSLFSAHINICSDAVHNAYVLWREEVKHLHEATFENKPPRTCLDLFEAILNFIGL